MYCGKQHGCVVSDDIFFSVQVRRENSELRSAKSSRSSKRTVSQKFISWRWSGLTTTGLWSICAIWARMWDWLENCCHELCWVHGQVVVGGSDPWDCRHLLGNRADVELLLDLCEFKPMSLTTLECILNNRQRESKSQHGKSVNVLSANHNIRQWYTRHWRIFNLQ